LEIEKMDKDTAGGKWKQMRGKLKEKWGKLTDDDLDKAEGNRDYLIGRVQEQYGLSKEEAQKQLDKLGN
jgi:uncharacterized protein YjbJ (UPF0337 family)